MLSPTTGRDYPQVRSVLNDHGSKGSWWTSAPSRAAAPKLISPHRFRLTSFELWHFRRIQPAAVGRPDPKMTLVAVPSYDLSLERLLKSLLPTRFRSVRSALMDPLSRR